MPSPAEAMPPACSFLPSLGEKTAQKCAQAKATGGRLAGEEPVPLNLAAGEAHGARALLCAPAHLLLPNPTPLTLHLGEPDQPPQSPMTALKGITEWIRALSLPGGAHEAPTPKPVTALEGGGELAQSSFDFGIKAPSSPGKLNPHVTKPCDSSGEYWGTDKGSVLIQGSL